MAVQHMVWIKFNEGIDADRQQWHMKNLASLAERVPAVKKLWVGANLTDRAGGCTHGLIVELADRAGLTEYLEHPEHVEVATPLKAEAALMAMDIEV